MYELNKQEIPQEDKGKRRKTAKSKRESKEQMKEREKKQKIMQEANYPAGLVNQLGHANVSPLLQGIDIAGVLPQNQEEMTEEQLRANIGLQ